MAITTRDQLIAALANNCTCSVIAKASLGNATAGAYGSLWRASGVPGAGTQPTTAVACSNATTGAMGFAQQVDPSKSYLAYAALMSTQASTTIEIHDRLAHMAGLSGTVITAQTVDLDLSLLLGSNNMTARIGNANYSQVLWWAEWYADTGSTSTTLTVNVTYNDDSTGNLNGITTTATTRGGRLYPLNSFIPSASAGKYIKKINSATLTATTGTAGNFGFTATRQLGIVPTTLANKTETADWAQLGLNEVKNNACLFALALNGASTASGVNGFVKLVHG